MYYVICRIDIEGYHFWKDAPEYCKYLRDQHRHRFCITAKFNAGHADRDIEINAQNDLMKVYFMKKYGYPCNFEGMSCEAIAKEVCEVFGCFEAEVLEDDFSGAGYKI